MTTYRMWVPNRRGRADLHFSAPEIGPASVIHIAASEATPLDSASILLPQGVQSFRPNFGLASLTVQNISAREGTVDFNVFVDWETPLNIMVDITILGFPDQIIIGS